MDIYGSHFEYRGVNSRKYNLVFATAETERYTNKTANISGVTMFDRKTKRQYLLEDDYSGSPISFDVEIVTCDGRPLERVELKEITKWLFSRSRYDRLYFDTFDDTELMLTEHHYEADKTDSTKRLYINCRFMNPEEMYYNGGIVGYKATLESDSPFLWQDEISETFTLTDRVSEYTINVDSDIDDYIYPRVEITKSDFQSIDLTDLFNAQSSVPPATGDIAVEGAIVKTDLSIGLEGGEHASAVRAELQESPGAFTIFIPVTAPLMHVVALPQSLFSSLWIGTLSCEAEDLTKGQVFEKFDRIYANGSAIGVIYINATGVSRYLAIYYVPKTSDDNDRILAPGGLQYSIAERVFQFTNGNDGGSMRRTLLNNLDFGESVTLDGKTCFVTAGLAERFVERNFPRLLSGDNHITITGNGGDTVKISWNNRRLP